MSYRRPNNQQPPAQGSYGYQDEYGQYQQPQGQDPRRNGVQYTGQGNYAQAQGGGPVQQPYAGYNDGYSPRAGSHGGGSYQSQTPQAQYNPQDWASTSYNPQHYPSPMQQQYNPADYGSPGIGTSGSGGSYGTSPAYSNGGFSPHQAPQGFAQTPQSTYSDQRSPTYQYTYSTDQTTRQYTSYQQTGANSTRTQTSPYPASENYPRRTGSQQYPGQPQYNASPSIPPVSDEWRPSPPSYQTSAPRPPQSMYPSNSYGSLPSPHSTTPGPTPPAHAPARSDTLNRHPQSRPLPGPPNSGQGSDYFNASQGHFAREDEEAFSQDELFEQVADAVRNAGSNSQGYHSPSISISRAPGTSTATSLPYPVDDPHFSNGSQLNGRLSPRQPNLQYSDESDVEGAQGLAMMQADAEAEELHRQNTSGQRRPVLFSNGHGVADASDSDGYPAVDMGTLGGGYDMPMSHGGDPAALMMSGRHTNGAHTYSQPNSSQHSSMRRSHASGSSQRSRGSAYEYRPDAHQPFSPFNTAARVDDGGTGGLAEPSADGRRQSFDEGDEYSFAEGPMQDRYPDEPLDIAYQQASTFYRPLPPPPEGQPPSRGTGLGGLPSQLEYPPGPDGYGGVYQHGQWVPRSTSLVSHTTTPQVTQPLRSKTDAEERKARLQQLRPYDTTPATGTSGMPLDLPTLPGKRFMPSQLGAPAFKKCEEPWSLMSILKWLISITNPEQVTEIKEAEIKEALVALFTNKVPTMNITDAEGLSTKVVQDMYKAETLVKTEEWVKIVPGPMEGVIFQLTGSGCYAPTLHDHVVPGRCYSHHCQRTLKKLNLQAQPSRTSEGWAQFYNMKPEDLEGKDSKEKDRQYILHEIVQTEDVYMDQLNVLRTVYRDPLAKAEPAVIPSRRKEKFLADVFGRLDAVKQANIEHLLPQLKYRQQEQGPWIVGFSDIFRQWIRKAKLAYIEYAGAFPGATFMVRQEIERNIDFRNFIDRARGDKRGGRLGWDTYLKAPITRLQRYTLLLNTVMGKMETDSEEKTNLKIALDEVRAVTLECDARVAEMQRKVDLSDLALKLRLRPGMQNAVELNLDHFGRELIYRGDLQRMGSNRFTWLDCHALLFDHYLVLAKPQRAESASKLETYDVSRLPIPMDLLVLESENDPAVQKTNVRGVTTVSVVTGRTTTPDVPATPRAPTTPLPDGVKARTGTSISSTSLQPVTSISDSSKDADRIMYPFKVKHLGRDDYTLFAPNENIRKDWCDRIKAAKQKHALSLHKQKAEPFKLRVMADSAFVFDGGATSKKSIVIQGTPVDRAIKEVEQKFRDVGRPIPICRARVNCATSFLTLDQTRHMVAVGTDYGVFLSDIENPRGWEKCINMQRVTQIAVLEEFNLFLLISDKSLIAYHLDVVCPSETTGVRQSNDSSRKAPQKLSGSKDVGFFVTGKMKDRTLVFYKKRENLASVFKVLEPIYQKSTEKKRSVFKRGATEFFRDYDEFYIPAECSGVDLFHSYLAASTARGFEVLTLDKKQPMSVPELSRPEVQNIATHIKDQKALNMLRLSDQEFLLVYTNCAVYVNKHGEVSRSVIMEFVGTAQSAALYGAYLLLFDKDFVEIRNAQNGRLKQIIAGNEIKCLDDGGSWSLSSPSLGQQQQQQQNTSYGMPPRTVKFVMQHPEMEKMQIVVELTLNENRRD